MNNNNTSETLATNPTSGWIEITYDDNSCMGSYSSNQSRITPDEYLRTMEAIMTSCAQKDNCKLTIHDNGVCSRTFKNGTESYWYITKS